jgi:hypothetical protein
MNGFLSMFGDWHFWLLILTYWVISNSISALPMPTAASSAFYGWFFKMSNGLLGNLSRALAGKIPGTSDVMPIPGAQEAVQQAAVVAKAVDIINNPGVK